MPKAVRFDDYGAIDVLRIEDVPRPVPGEGQVLVQVKAAGINPGEAKVREGLLRERWPATFPSGQGSDLAGVVAETGPGVTGFSAGDEVIGWTDNRASQAEYVLTGAGNLTAKPAGVPWEAAGALFVAGTTAYATVRAVALTPGGTVVVAGASGGVGSLAVQLARRAGATVVGLASEPHHAWLTAHGVIPVSYGDGVADRIRQAAGQIDAWTQASRITVRSTVTDPPEPRPYLASISTDPAMSTAFGSRSRGRRRWAALARAASGMNSVS